MGSIVKLELLILSNPSRTLFLRQLLELLNPQIDRINRAHDQVSCSIWYDTTDNFRGKDLGGKREQIRLGSSGEYICFIDDDDFIAPNYLDRIVPLCFEVDQVGFDVQIYKNGKPYGYAIHSITNKGWNNKTAVMGERYFERDISHLNPMRRQLALEVAMAGGIGEDHRWAEAMRGKVKTERYINEVMYHYLWRDPKNDQKDHNETKRLQIMAGLKK